MAAYLDALNAVTSGELIGENAVRGNGYAKIGPVQRQLAGMASMRRQARLSGAAREER